MTNVRMMHGCIKAFPRFAAMSQNLTEMPNYRIPPWLFGTVSVGMTILGWFALLLPPAAKVDSALRSLPIFGPLTWIEVWFLATAVFGIAASFKRRIWIVAPVFAVGTLIAFLVRILN